MVSAQLYPVLERVQAAAVCAGHAGWAFHDCCADAAPAWALAHATQQQGHESHEVHQHP